MKRITDLGVKALVCMGLFMTAGTANATTVVTDSPYDRFAGQAAVKNQLTDWLGKGSLTLTSIFDSLVWGDKHYAETGQIRGFYPAELDAIVSGKGPTFTVMYATLPNIGYTQIIGWYNPINGVTAVGGNAGENSYDAFLFNLTTGRVMRPEYYPYYTEEQRVSNVNAGLDLILSDTRAGRIDYYMDTYSDSLSYSGSNGPRGLFWKPTGSLSQTITQASLGINYMAVYSISVDSLASAAAVPEPATWAMMLVAFGLIGGAARYQRRRTMITYA